MDKTRNQCDSCEAWTLASLVSFRRGGRCWLCPACKKKHDDGIEARRQPPSRSALEILVGKPKRMPSVLLASDKNTPQGGKKIPEDRQTVLFSGEAV